MKVGLLAAGVSPTASDSFGQAGLHGAACGGDEAFGALLIALGCDPNARTVKAKHTALHFAALRNRLRMMRLLVWAGADVTSRTTDERNETAGEVARRCGHAAFAAELERAVAAMDTDWGGRS